MQFKNIMFSFYVENVMIKYVMQDIDVLYYIIVYRCILCYIKYCEDTNYPVRINHFHSTV